MNVQDAKVPRDPLQREGQGHTQDPELPLMLRVTGDSGLMVVWTDRTGSIPWRITAPSDSSGRAAVRLDASAPRLLALVGRWVGREHLPAACAAPTAAHRTGGPCRAHLRATVGAHLCPRLGRLSEVRSRLWARGRLSYGAGRTGSRTE